MTMMNDIRMLGTRSILSLPKTGFLCSREISSTCVLRSYDWAISQAMKNACVIGGFHSRIEKDVLRFLINRTQPLIIVLARGFYRHWQPEIKARLDKGNLLIISPFDDSVTTVTPRTCLIRNNLIVELSDRVVIGYASPNGKLSKLINDTNKPLEFLDQ